MKLYSDDALIHPAAGAADVVRAFEELPKRPSRRLELRRDGRSSMSVTFEPATGLFVDISSPAAIFGWLAPAEARGEVLASFLDFLAGKNPCPPSMPVSELGDMEQIVIGQEFEPDCPLCAAMAARGPRV